MLNSFKQLIRTPVKAVLFFLLMATCSLLLVFGSVLLFKSMRRIDAAEAQFTTLGTVEQLPSSSENTADLNSVGRTLQGASRVKTVNSYKEVFSSGILDFEGADYVFKTESRPYYHALLPALNHAGAWSGYDDQGVYIMEFTPLEDGVLSSPVKVRVESVLFRHDRLDFIRALNLDKIDSGTEIEIWDIYTDEVLSIQAGKTYIATLAADIVGREKVVGWDVAGTGQGAEAAKLGFAVYPGPYSSQVGTERREAFLEDAGVRAQITEGYGSQSVGRVQEVTEGFYDGPGKTWLNWVKAHEELSHWFLVAPTNSLELLPSFHEKQAYIEKGRRITAEEFESGAPVCLVTSDFAAQNQLAIGDKITLPLHFALYGWVPIGSLAPTYHNGYSPLNSDYEPYEPFWQAEYQVVGTYRVMESVRVGLGVSEFMPDMFIIPSNSVKASDVNNIAYHGPMKEETASFQIPNGSVEAFDAALRQAVPEAAQMKIVYDDNGYSEVIVSLQSARLTAILLFAVGLFATLAIAVLLLYFFILRQKKRTAIERSLGMGKNQCRQSLIAGVLALTLAASVAGSACGALLLNAPGREDEAAESAQFSTDYSVWAASGQVEFDEPEDDGTAAFYIGIPLGLLLLVLVLSLFLVERNLAAEPIEMLSTKTE